MRIDNNTNRLMQWFPQVMKAQQLLLIHQFVTLAKSLIILLKIYALNICTYEHCTRTFAHIFQS